MKKKTTKTPFINNTKVVSKGLHPSDGNILSEAISFFKWLPVFFMSIYGKISIISLNKKIICIAITFITTFLYYPSRIDDYDIFYHLTFGEYFVKNQTFQLDHSIFSWTPADSNWRYGIWIGSSVLYLIYELLSFKGLFIFQWFVLLSIVLFYVWYNKMLNITINVVDILFIVCLYSALNLTAIYIKPELFTTLFFTITVFIYFTIKFTSNQKLFYIFPPLLLLWVNTHGGYLMGLYFLTIVLIGESLNCFVIKNNNMPLKNIKHFSVALFLSYIAVIFNPYGVDYHIGIIKSLIEEEYMGYAKRVFAWIDVWRYLIPKGDFAFRFFNTGWILVCMFILHVILTIYLVVKKRFFDITIIVIDMVLFYHGMKNARVTLFLPIFWIFSTAYLFKKAEITAIKDKLAPLAFIVFVVFTLYVSVFGISTLDDRSWFGTNIERYSPQKEIEFIKKHKLPQPLFNDYLIGAYVMWKLYPEYKVSIDPRYGPYWKEFGPEYFRMLETLSADAIRALHTKYNFKTVLITMHSTNIINAFIKLPEWKLLFFDKSAAVIVHESVVPTLSEETLNVSLGTDRFKDVRNPFVLHNLFSFYVQIHPNYGLEMLNIYKRNVSNLYINKYDMIEFMKNTIKAKQNEISSRAK